MNILREIRNYFKKYKIVSEKDLLAHFDVEKSALLEIVKLLISKKYIKIINCNSCSGNCNVCSLSNKDTYYQFIS